MDGIRRFWSAGVLAVCLTFLLLCGSAQAATTLSPFGASGYRYAVGPIGFGAGFEAPAFADAGWATGAGGFGAPGASCGFPVSTSWVGNNTDVLTRKQLAVPSGATNVVIRGRVDDSVQIFYNGVSIYNDLGRAACASSGYDFAATVPAGLVNAGATNVVAVRARNFGGNQFFDYEVVADVPPAAADLAMSVTGSPSPVRAGDPLAITYTVTNGGPGSTVGSTFTATVPAQTTLAATPSGCSRSGQTLTCSVPVLASGASSSRTITYTVDPTATGTISAPATSVPNASVPDTNAANNSATATVTVVDTADLSLTKTVDTATAAPGATRTFTLTARNDGPADARTVTVTDALPSGVTFASASAGCTRTGNTVSCTADRLDSGQTRTFTVTVTVDPVTLPAAHQHQLTISKTELDVALDPGQTSDVALSCPGGGLLVDVSFGVNHVDQGTGTAADVDVSRLVSVDLSTYAATVTNKATGRATGKLYGLCLPPRTTDTDGHSHALSLGGLGTVSVPAGAGRQTATLTCAAGSVVAAPGITVTGGRARLVGSQRDGSRRVFTVDVLDPGAAVTVSGRCLDLRTGTTNGHAHDLVLNDVLRTVTVPAGATVTEPVICGDNAKGVLASYLAPAGILLLGNEPQPKTRVFTLQNTTGGPLDVQLGLTCVDDRTSDPVVAQRIVNTATLTNAAPVRDPDSDDRTASAALLVVAGDPEPASNPAPAAAPTSPPAAPARPSTAARTDAIAVPLLATLARTGTSVALPVTCSAACSGSVTLVALRAVGGPKAGTVLGSATFDRTAGKRVLHVRLKAVARAAARRGHLRRAKAIVRQRGVAGARSRIVLLR